MCAKSPFLWQKQHLNLYKIPHKPHRFCLGQHQTNQSVSIQFSAGLFCALQAVRAQSPGACVSASRRQEPPRVLVLALRRWEPPLVLRLRRHASRRCARQAAGGDAAHPGTDLRRRRFAHRTSPRDERRVRVWACRPVRVRLGCFTNLHRQSA